MENEFLLNPKELYSYLKNRLIKGRTVYFFLDEIQNVEGFERVLDSLYVKDGVDIYITGSSANLFSSEIATLLTGRYVEINVMPFSFMEVIKARSENNNMAKALVDIVPQGNYFLMGGSPVDNNAKLFRAGQMKVLKPYVDSGKIKVVGDQWVDGWLPETTRSPRSTQRLTFSRTKGSFRS